METLPDDIQRDIFFYLPMEDISRLSRSSKGMNQLVSGAINPNTEGGQSWWRRMLISKFKPYQFEEFVNYPPNQVYIVLAFYRHLMLFLEVSMRENKMKYVKHYIESRAPEQLRNLLTHDSSSITGGREELLKLGRYDLFNKSLVEDISPHNTRYVISFLIEEYTGSRKVLSDLISDASTEHSTKTAIIIALLYEFRAKDVYKDRTKFYSQDTIYGLLKEAILSFKEPITVDDWRPILFVVKEIDMPGLIKRIVDYLPKAGDGRPQGIDAALIGLIQAGIEMYVSNPIIEAGANINDNPAGRPLQEAVKRKNSSAIEWITSSKKFIHGLVLRKDFNKLSGPSKENIKRSPSTRIVTKFPES